MMKKNDFVVVIEDNKEVIYNVVSVPYEDLADCTAYHADYGFIQSGLNPTADYPTATTEQVQEFKEAYSAMLAEMQAPVLRFSNTDYAVKKILGIRYSFRVTDKTATTLVVMATECDTNHLVNQVSTKELNLPIQIDQRKNEEYVTIFGIKVFASQDSYIF